MAGYQDADASGVALPDAFALHQALATEPSRVVGDGRIEILVKGEKIRLHPDADEISLCMHRAYLVDGWSAVDDICEACRERLDQVERIIPIAGIPDNYDDLTFERRTLGAILVLLKRARAEIAQFEELALSWYERKLLAVLAKDFELRGKVLGRYWSEIYRVGDPAQPAKQQEIGQIKSPAGLAIRGQRTEVIDAAHDLAMKWHAYLEAVWSASTRQAVGGFNDDGSALSYAAKYIRDKREEFKRARDLCARTHFIVLRVYRDAIKKETDKLKNQQTQRDIERLVIAALLDAYHGRSDTLKEFQSSAIFAGDGVVRAANPGSWAVGAVKIYAVRASESTLSKSLWLQVPLHERMHKISNEITDAKKREASRKASPQKAGAKPAQKSPAGSAAGANSQGTPAAGAAPDPGLDSIDHLTDLFETDEIRKLEYFFLYGSMAFRARHDATQTIAEAIAASNQGLKDLAAYVNAIGMLLAPVTEGGSFALASAIDAAIVLVLTTRQLSNAMQMEALSKQALDALADTYWKDPDAAQVAGVILEAGLQIASDVITEGTFSHVLNAMAMASVLLPPSADFSPVIPESGDVANPDG